MGKKVLMVGWHPTVVDYSKYPGLTADKLEGALKADEKKLNDQGYDASIGFIFSGATATDQLTETLKETHYDVVMIGAGVRKDDDHFLIFEEIVNIVHEHAPDASIAFNTGPTDSDAAIRRWDLMSPLSNGETVMRIKDRYRRHDGNAATGAQSGRSTFRRQCPLLG